MSSYLKNYFNLERSFVFYGAYHHHWMNQMIHVLFVPAIFTGMLSFLARVPVAGNIDLSQIVAVLYSVSFIKMEPIAGALYVPVIAAMEYVAAHILVSHVPMSIGICVLGLATQILGHKFCERRQPAFMDDPFQATHAAVFFVWLEVLFFLGYRPAKKSELERLVEERIRKLNAAEGAADAPMPKAALRKKKTST